MTSIASAPRDLTRTTLVVLFIVGLIAASFWILRPFLAAAIWAAMIVVASWPLMLRIQARLGGRRALAVSAMIIVLLLVYIVPFALAINTVLDNAERIAGWATALADLKLPSLPETVRRWPLVGARVAGAWERVAAASAEDLAARHSCTRKARARHGPCCASQGGWPESMGSTPCNWPRRPFAALPSVSS